MCFLPSCSEGLRAALIKDGQSAHPQQDPQHLAVLRVGSVNAAVAIGLMPLLRTEVRRYAQAENYLRKSGLDYTIVR